MSAIAYTVPESDVEGLRRALIDVYGATCEALSRDLIGYRGGDVGLETVEARRRRVASIEGLLERLGWDLSPATEPVAINADRALLETGYRSMVIDAVEALHEHVESRDWPAATVAQMIGDVDRLQGLLERIADLAAR